MKYKIKDLVKITDLETKGRILGIYEDAHGMQYQIRYFIGGEVKNVYFLEDEIEPYKKEKSVGIRS